jgi:methylmalonyl-CoA mutase N-terminal domain/subunit
MRQYAGFGTAAESNARYRYLLSQGVSGLSVAFDLPTQMGYDSDHAMAAGEVGRVGVAIDSIDDMTALFDGIPLDKVSTSMTINSTAIILLALYVAVATPGRGVAQLVGHRAERRPEGYRAGTYIIRRATIAHRHRHFRVVRSRLPNWNTICQRVSHPRGGSTAVQEVAFTPANAIGYARPRAGRPGPEWLGQRLSFFNARHDFLEEIAKFRAARRLWARLCRDRFGDQSPRHVPGFTQTRSR